jgi:phosphohistidine swiveling domain-containing protein
MLNRLIDSNNKGNKVEKLKILLQNNFNIPDGFVINPGTPFNKVKEKFNIIKENIDFPWILRSSSETEDNLVSSYAGCFESFGNINNIDQAEEQFEKIIKITESARSIGILKGENPKPPFVLIQPFIQFRFKGVYFSPDPFSHEKFRIEYGKNDEITSGGSPVKKPLGIEQELYLTGEKIKHLFNWKNIDMEWGLKNSGEIVILQVRPYLPGGDRIPNLMKKGCWKLDIEHNPLPLSHLHKSIIEQINIYGDAGIHVWNGYLYYKNSTSESVSESEIYSSLKKLKNKIKILALGSFNNENLKLILDHFSEFVILYLSKPIIETEPGNILINKSLRFLATLEGNLDLNNLYVVDFINKYGVLPEFWDISSSFLRENKTKFLLFLQKINGLCSFLKDIENFNELDDLLFGESLYYLKQFFLKQTNINLENPSDLFYLSINEIFFPPENLNQLVILRKLNYEVEKSKIPPVKIVNSVKFYPDFKNNNLEKYAGKILVKGKTEGEVYLINETIDSKNKTNDSNLKSCIIVAHSLTPQDIIKVFNASGIVLESDNYLGHGSIIARELGIPTLIGVKNATKILNQGDKIYLDCEVGNFIIFK